MHLAWMNLWPSKTIMCFQQPKESPSKTKMKNVAYRCIIYSSPPTIRSGTFRWRCLGTKGCMDCGNFIRMMKNNRYPNTGTRIVSSCLIFHGIQYALMGLFSSSCMARWAETQRKDMPSYSKYGNGFLMLFWGVETKPSWWYFHKWSCLSHLTVRLRFLRTWCYTPTLHCMIAVGFPISIWPLSCICSQVKRLHGRPWQVKDRLLSGLLVCPRRLSTCKVVCFLPRIVFSSEGKAPVTDNKIMYVRSKLFLLCGRTRSFVCCFWG